MVKIENYLGTVAISQAYFANIIGNAVSSCYGVAGMVHSGTRQGLRSVFSRRRFADEGVRLRGEGTRLIVDLHITVIYGMNIATIAQSISHKVRYAVEQATGLDVQKVNVFVDGMKND